MKATIISSVRQIGSGYEHKKTILLLLIITLLGCTEETIINNYSAEGLGKTNVYIEGNITNEEAQAKLIAEIGSQTENIYVQETTQLTDITINFSKNLRDIYFNNNQYLKNINIKGTNNKINKIEIEDGHYLNKILINGVVEANQLDFGHMAGDYNLNEFIDIECHDLVTIQGNLRLFIGQYDHPVFNKLNFYDLKYINKTIKNSTYNRWQGNYSEFNMPELREVHNLEHYIHVTNLEYPNLSKINNLGIDYGPINQEINFPILEMSNIIGMEVYSGVVNLPRLLTTKYFAVSGNNSIINTPILERADYLHWLSNDNIIMPNLNYCIEYERYPPSSEAVNNVLNQFININPTSGKHIKLYGYLATGQGIIDKQTLINQGNTVTNY
ncbi:Lipoprotein [Flavobacterium branchiophilum]|uniref:Lipoprotein n=1 Tax=Flavobacterium branchiophilum (strain FL-15) TaxID=1034807 RepID=G2Z366_FLABF|nr:hypothetical protein [Flavobacterium branchiophilum]CCB68179.1 Hypothetical protein FBFL15_0022 [Flavobacterium branchiophilum FL-15]